MCYPYRVNASLDLIPYAIQILEILKSQSVSVNSLPCYSSTSESFLILLSQFNFNPFSPSSIMILHKNILLRQPLIYLDLNSDSYLDSDSDLDLDSDPV